MTPGFEMKARRTKAHMKLLFVFIVYIKGGKTITSITKKTTTKQKINNFCLYPWRKIYDERHELYWYQGFLIYILNNQNNLLGSNKVRLKEWWMHGPYKTLGLAKF